MSAADKRAWSSGVRGILDAGAIDWPGPFVRRVLALGRW
jgi:hypothetical protein